MCRGLSEGGRRCPGCVGETRRERDRARYAIKKVHQNLPGSGDGVTLTEPDVGRMPTVAMIHAQRKRVDEAWVAGDSAAAVDPQDGSTARLEYEESVRVLGELVHARALRKAGIEPEDQAAINDERGARATAALEKYATASRALVAAEKRYREPDSDLASIDALDEARAYRREAFSALMATKQDLERETAERNDRYADAYRDGLAEVRPLGGTPVECHPRSPKRAREAVNAAATAMPTEWAAASNDSHDGGRPLLVKLTKSRAHYAAATVTKSGEYTRRTRLIQTTDDAAEPPSWPTPGRGETWERQDEPYPVETYDSEGHLTQKATYRWKLLGRRLAAQQITAELTISGDTDDSRLRVARHEFSHRVEGLNDRIAHACHTFRYRRTLQPDGEQEPRQVIYAGTREYGWRDEFANHYMGRDYGNLTATKHSEVFSMGVESVFSGSNGGLRGDGPNEKPDPEHRNLILGLFASA